ncbi:MAG: hypothetical protein ACE5I3_11300 [Phycisphaerae bacterium]
MPETCQHCGRLLSPGEPGFLTDNQTRVVCRPCLETTERNVIIRPELAHYGITNDAAARKRDELTANLGRKPNRIEVIQALYDDLLAHADPRQRSSMYIGLAVEYHLAGLDPFPIKQEIARATLAGFHGRHVRILSSKGCEACRALNGRVLTVDEALEQMPIPCRDCTYGISDTEPFGWCRCMYISVRKPKR